jgi:hypothetical protein
MDQEHHVLPRDSAGGIAGGPLEEAAALGIGYGLLQHPVPQRRLRVDRGSSLLACVPGPILLAFET